ncbi:unnamed protein product [Echinostoma caproni]|uniref:PA domain-containing protein n=1 Tax=Echinostoma caproni TaxID=27848 RepID=A0A183AYJ7_9TREM|nr:unnamed protein product [Echinostoma caproni]
MVAPQLTIIKLSSQFAVTRANRTAVHTKFATDYHYTDRALQAFISLGACAFLTLLLSGVFFSVHSSLTYNYSGFLRHPEEASTETASVPHTQYSGSHHGWITEQQTEDNPDIILFNVRGLLNKRDEIEAFAHARKPAVVALTETWPVGDIAESEVSIPGYIVCRANRNPKRREMD